MFAEVDWLHAERNHLVGCCYLNIIIDNADVFSV
jgi:hypothetical protein